MDIGFDTTGNASLICYDKKPVLVTDPWLGNCVYFGSWILRHPIPEEQLQAMRQCDYVWISHGHPDHLNGESLNQLMGKTILLPDHVGRRVWGSLTEKGHKVQILPDRQWVSLTDRIRIICIADYNQDGVLLIDINGRLLFNMNDAGDKGWFRSVKKIVKDYDVSFLLRGSGLADMANFYDEDDTFVSPIILPSGPYLANLAENFGVRYYIPFSANHYNQRRDSAWAEVYATPYSDYAIDFNSSKCTILPPFIRYNCGDDTSEEIPTLTVLDLIKEPEEFGDNWNDVLEKSDLTSIEHYFCSIAHLFDFLDFINIRVGGQDHFITFHKKGKYNRGITFETPRNSLMTAIEYEIFDDLLIGNFMKTTLHGKWGKSQLYPDFTPFVSKYADNGGAKTQEQLRNYMREYMRRAPLEHLIHRLELETKNLFRNYVSHESKFYSIARDLYHRYG